jgi:DnaA N-terminal domain
MLTALKEIVDLKTLLFLDNHEECPQCQETKWLPSPNGRRCLHRHDELTVRVIPHLGVLLRDFCKDFKTDNDGLIHLLLRGLQTEGVLKGDSSLVAESQQTHDQEHTTIEAKEVVAESQQPHDTAPQTTRAKEESPTLELDKGPDLWAPIAEPLKERVSAQNFEIWLSSVRFVSATEQKLVLACPNSFFQEYLTEHYTEVIQEELQKIGAAREVSFEVGIQTPKEAPPTRQEPAKEAEPPKKEAAPMSPKRARREATRDQLKERCCVYQNGRSTFLISDYTSRLALLKAEEDEEDRREKLEELRRAKEAIDEARRDQFAKKSHWWSEDKTPKKLRQLSEQLDRADKKGTNQPKRE